MFASGVAGVPWSLTVHRWDIREDNLLRSKLDSASFVRAVSADGLHDLERIVGPIRTPALVLHMGVPLPAGALDARGRRTDDATLRVLVPAGLLEVKGHRYLVDAIRVLRSRGTHVRVGLAGAGPLRAAIEQQVADASLAEECVLLGQLSHSELLRQLEDGEWDAVVLASVETASGEKEGIPVVFLEAMSYGLPVVGTAVGGIPELLGDGAGLLVPSRNAVVLADAIERLARDPALRARLGRLGRERVERDFSVEAVVRELAAQFERAAR
jgi:glycosyltransferase involved in cell wall biosynthesis